MDLATGQSARVAVISYRCWQHRFGGAPDVIGKTLTVDANPLTVVGVTGPDFSAIDRDWTPEAIVPIGFGHPPSVQGYSLRFTARLRPGVTLARARAAIATASPALLANLDRSEPNFRFPSGTAPRRLVLGPEWRGASVMRKMFSKSALLLLGLAGLVFLVACLNLSTLVLARSNARLPEFRVRLALGATRWTILRLILMDVLLISSAGAVLGVFIADWGMRVLIRSFWIGWIPPGIHMRPSLGVLALAGLAALLIASAIGIVPATRIARLTPARPGLGAQSAGRSSRTGGATWLAASETAFALVLVTLALTLESIVYRSVSANLGYDQNHVLSLDLFQQQSPAATVPGGQLYYPRLAARLRGLPGVESVSYSFELPIFPYVYAKPVSTTHRSEPAEYASVGPGFFHLLKIPIVMGREFNWNDSAKSSRRVVIISQALAAKLFPGRNPVGEEVRFSPEGTAKPALVVGVTRDAALWKPEIPAPEAIFSPFSKECMTEGCGPAVLIRTRGNPMALARTSDAVIRSFGYQYSMQTQSLAQKFEKSLVPQRFAAWLSVDFALIALGLACLGLYALISYRVAERNKEIAIRMALGARGQQILGLVLSEAFVVVVAGILIAIPFLAVALRVLAASGAVIPNHMLAEEIGGAAVLIAAAILAVYAPASKAAKTNPGTLLRSE